MPPPGRSPLPAPAGPARIYIPGGCAGRKAPPDAAGTGRCPRRTRTRAVLPGAGPPPGWSPPGLGTRRISGGFAARSTGMSARHPSRGKPPAARPRSPPQWRPPPPCPPCRRTERPTGRFPYTDPTGTCRRRPAVRPASPSPAGWQAPGPAASSVPA